MEIDLERVRDVLDDGGAVPGTFRVLVDRLWPRGIAKERLSYDLWGKEVAPSSDLRTAFHHGELSFAEFAERYRAELAAGGAAHDLLGAARAAGARRITLLHSARDAEQNHALVLRDALEEALREEGR
ncbi:DUF488 family protein [Brachybacterium sp. J144]|uniref:DUF488 domain-containing protein n=1 Tax=Brachybacterium sp. J144 TaxID=3116487 RepID=UPI002E775271|nr:DUF488 family protein [Brachybacterium sp. J144]MEE1652056.1 DUF488 family protein [Brachybacterium sp. J144]